MAAIVTLYRVHLTHEFGTSVGYKWDTNKQRLIHDAKTRRHAERGNNNGDIETVYVDLTKDAVWNFAQRFASYPDNG